MFLGAMSNTNVLRKKFETRVLSSLKTSKRIVDKSSVIIVGAGAFGSSLALELVTNYREKYTSIATYEAKVDTVASTFSINGQSLPEMLRRRIPEKL